MTATKPVVLIAEELSPATVQALGPDFEIRSTNGADRSQLLAAIADVDAILVRSATQVDAEAIAAAPKLKVIARPVSAWTTWTSRPPPRPVSWW